MGGHTNVTLCAGLFPKRVRPNMITWSRQHLKKQPLVLALVGLLAGRAQRYVAAASARGGVFGKGENNCSARAAALC